MMNQNKRAQRRGITSVEFALIIPVLMVMIMGIVEMGTMFHSWLTLQKAAQSGARFAATGQGEEEGTRIAQIQQVTGNWLESLDKGDKEISISSWASPAAEGDGASGNAGGPCQLVEVAVVYAYHPYTPIVGSLLPEVIPILGSDRKLNEPWKPCDEN